MKDRNTTGSILRNPFTVISRHIAAIYRPSLDSWSDEYAIAQFGSFIIIMGLLYSWLLWW